MKKSLWLFLIAPFLLTGCNFSVIPTSKNEETQNNKENNTEEENTKKEEKDETDEQSVSEWPKQYQDIVFSYLKGNLPYLKAFNFFKTGCMDGSSKPFFNPAIEKCGRDFTQEYDQALRKMGYKYIDSDNYSGYTKRNYQKGTFWVSTAHYAETSSKYWFDVYAWNDKDQEVLHFIPTLSLNAGDLGLKSGYNSLSTTIKGITITSNSVCKDNNGIQINKDSTFNFKGELHEMDLLINKNAHSCLIYAGTSENNFKIIYNDACYFKFPSGTKYVQIKTLDKALNIEEICIR